MRGEKVSRRPVSAWDASITLRVAVVDENELFARGLRASLASYLDVTTEPDATVDVAVVSPGAARERSFGCPLVICGDPPNPLAPGNVVLNVLPRRTLTPRQLLVSVRTAAAEWRFRPPGAAPTFLLEGRPLDVLKLLATGTDMGQIAQDLDYSDRTIKNVIRELQLALGTSNRAQTVAEGVRQGFIQLGAVPERCEKTSGADPGI